MAHGDAGLFFQQEKALFGDKFSDMPSAIASRRAGPAFEFGFPAADGSGSSFGSTVENGRPYYAWNCYAHTSGDRYTTNGKPGWTSFSAEGNLIFARVPLANASNQAPVEAFRLGADGRGEFALGPIAPNYVVAGVQVVGPRGAAVPDAAMAAAAPTKAEFDALAGTVNTLLSRLRAHGLIA